MFGRLNVAYGWTWQYEDGTRGPFILSKVERYAGMISGWTPTGQKCARPVSELEALSLDGTVWYPTAHLIAYVPLEPRNGVRRRYMPLPLAFDEDQ